MTSPADVDSVLSAIPASIPAIGAGIAGLTHAGVASATAFLVEGRRCTVDGSARGTDARIVFGATPAVSAVDASLGPAVNVVRTPGLVRRERAGPRGTATETVLAAPTLPLVLVQWSGPASALPDSVRIEVDPSAGLLDREPSDGARGVVLRAADDRLVALACVPEPARVEREPKGDSIAFVLPTTGERAAGTVTLVVACGTLAEVRAALAASAHAPAHAVRAAMPADDDGMVLETGVPEIDDGVAWARVRLRGIASRLDPASPTTSLSTGLAALAVGDEESARAALAALAPEGPEHALLAARIAATLGDPAAALAAAGLATGERRTTHAGVADGALFAVAAEALSEGLRHAAPDTVIAELRQLAATPASGPGLEPSRPGGRSLPMAGRVRGGEARWLSRLLTGNPDALPPGGTDAAVTELRLATSAFVSDPDAGWKLWRQALGKGLEDGPTGPCSWDAPHRAGAPATGSVTAELLLALGHGLLGTAPDTPVGRLRLAPRLPSHLRSFLARGIPLGEARLAMAYERVGLTHRFTLTPEIASVPPLVVFEPTVHGEVVATRIDGATAALDAKPATGESGRAPRRTVVPVQLPLDAVRTVEIDVSPEP